MDNNLDPNIFMSLLMLGMLNLLFFFIIVKISCVYIAFKFVSAINL